MFSVITFHVCTEMPRRRLSKSVSGQSVSLYKFSRHTFHLGILFCTIETPKEVLFMYPNSLVHPGGTKLCTCSIP